MKTYHHPNLKTTQCPLFSCGFFGHCTQTVLSPTTPNPPSLPPLPAPSSPSLPPSTTAPPPPPPPQQDSKSSSSNTFQSFTQWRFSHSPISTSFYNPSSPQPHDQFQDSVRVDPQPGPITDSELPLVIIRDLKELYHVAELQLSTGSDSDRVRALHMLERSLVPDNNGGACIACPATVMKWVLHYLKESQLSKPATKILLALCLTEGSRHVAVEEGAVGKVVEAIADLEGSAVERALAALELLCMVAEGAAELRTQALVVPLMVEIMKRMEGTRGKEYAISVLAVIFGGSGDGEAYAPPEEVARAVLLALQGDCSARGRRKGAQLLKILQDHGRLDLTQEGE